MGIQCFFASTELASILSGPVSKTRQCKESTVADWLADITTGVCIEMGVTCLKGTPLRWSSRPSVGARTGQAPNQRKTF
jgi:hypothetical protein